MWVGVSMYKRSRDFGIRIIVYFIVRFTRSKLLWCRIHPVIHVRQAWLFLCGFFAGHLKEVTLLSRSQVTPLSPPTHEKCQIKSVSNVYCPSVAQGRRGRQIERSNSAKDDLVVCREMFLEQILWISQFAQPGD